MTLSAFIEEKANKAVLAAADLLFLGDSEDTVDGHYTIKQISISQLQALLQSQVNGLCVTTTSTTDGWETVYTSTIGLNMVEYLDAEVIAYTKDGNNAVEYVAMFNLKGLVYRIGSDEPATHPVTYPYITILHKDSVLNDLDFRWSTDISGTVTIDVRGIEDVVYWKMLIKNSQSWDYATGQSSTVSATRFDQLADVEIDPDTLADDQVPMYDNDDEKWKNTFIFQTKIVPTFALGALAFFPAITSPIEFGNTVTTVSLAWTLPTYASISRTPLVLNFRLDSGSTVSIADTSTLSYTEVHAVPIVDSVSGTTVVTTSRYKLFGTGDDGSSFAQTLSLTWGFKTRWGAYASISLASEAEVLALVSDAIRTTQSSLNTSYTITVSGTEYLYIAIPEGFTSLTTFVVGGLTTTFVDQGTTAFDVDAQGTSFCKYKVFRSLLPQTSGTYVVTVTG